MEVLYLSLFRYLLKILRKHKLR